MKKTNLTKKLSLNKVTIAGLNASNQAGVLGGFAGDTGPTDDTCKSCFPTFQDTCNCQWTGKLTCYDVAACYFPVTSEPTDPTYTC
ncbi:MAG: hypothetical protein GY765_34440 [bacterium]|nr:hypothetical protein [bacterium]